MASKTEINIIAFLRAKLIVILSVALLCVVFSLPAAASYLPFNTSVNMNVGLGTATPQAALVVTNGNVGIGTWTAAGGNLIVKGGGNVGIGSAWPGQVLDVNGTVRTTGFTMTGQSPTIGYVLTAADSTGDTTWSSTGIIGGWTVSGSNVYETSMGNVGIGTTTVNQGALVVTNGNVGIGTWAPAGLLQVNGTPNSPFIVTSSGNVGIGTTVPGQALDILGTVRTSLGAIFNGNVGIGTFTAISPLQIKGGALPVGGSQINSFDYETGTAAGSIYDANLQQNISSASNSAGSFIDLSIYSSVNTNVNYTGFIASLQEQFVNNGTGTLSNAVGGQYEVSNTTSGIITTGEAGYFAVNNQSTGSVTNAFGAYVGPVQGGNYGYGVYVNGVTGATNNYDFYGYDPSAQNYFAGNVGIGTITPFSALSVVGNIGIGTGINSPYITTVPPSGGMIVQGNVGIGSLHPGTALDVNGTARMTGLTLAGNGAANGYVMVGNSIGVGTWMAVSSLGAGGTPGGSSTQIQYNNGGVLGGIVNSNVTTMGNVGLGTTLSANKLDIQGAVGIGTAYAGYTAAPPNGLIVQGNVGIGSASPGQNLDVQGTLRALGEIVNGNVGIGTSANQGALSVMNGNVGIGTYSPTALFQVAGVGNVGINSAAPGAALDVNGMTRTTGLTLSGNGAASGYVMVGNSVGVGTWMAASSLGATSTPGGSSAQIQYNLGGVFAGIVNSNVTTTGNVGLGTTLSANKLDVQGAVGIGTAYAGYTAAPPNGLIVQGNVGIGSLAPGTALDVNGTTRMTGLTLTGNGAANGYVMVGNSVGVGTWMPVSSLGAGGTPGGSSAQIQYNLGGNFAGIANSNVTTTGNVGLGTTLSANKLDIQGAVGIGTAYAGYTSAPPNGLIVQGNVGIGSAAPGTALDVNGTARMTGLTLTGNGANNGYVMVGNSIGVGTWMPVSTLGTTSTPGGSSAQVQYNLGGAFTGIANSNVTTTGNVGLGTTLSANKLDIQGGVGIGTAYAGYTSAPPNGLIVQGNVGIGSTAPGQKLDVQGTTRAIGEIVNGNVGIGTSFTNNGTFALSVMNGNVGIGTWVPGELLDVAGYVRSSSRLLITNVSTGSDGLYMDDGFGSTLITLTRNANNTEILNANIGDLNLQSSSGNLIKIAAYGTAGQVMTISPPGNVGINTIAPNGLLDVEGTVSSVFNAVTGNANVGIGSFTPGQKLDVQGTARMTGLTLTGNGANNGYVMVGNSIGVGTWMPVSSLGAGGTPGGSSAQVQYNLGGNFAGIANSNVTTTGNVGLGTTLSANKLDIQGAVGIGTAYAGYTSAPPNGLIVQGNVGIGSSAPGQNLDVKGTIRDIGELINGNVGIGTSLINGTGEAALTVMNGNVGIGTWVPRAQLDVEGSLSIATFAGNVGIGSVSPGTILDVQGNLRVSGAGFSDFTTNVGINSAAPGAALDVVGAARMTGLTLTGNGANNGYVMVGNSVGVGTWMPVSTLGATSTPGGSSAQIQYNLGGAFAGIVNSNVTTTGNVGLGTTLSANKLDVQGAVGIGTAYAGYTAAPPNGLIVQGNVGIGSVAPGQVLDVQGTIRSIGAIHTGNVGIGTSFVNGAGEAALTVMNGNVGIGTWLPHAQLDVEGSLSIASFGGNVGIGSLSPGTALDVQGNLRVSNGGAFNEFLTNVGINSAAPGAALDVNGAARMTGLTLTGNGANNGYVMVGNSIGVGTWMPVGTLGAGGLPGGSSAQIQYNLGGVFTGIVNSNVTTTGNVGLGTTLSANKLDIQGGVGIGTAYAGYTAAPPNGLIVQGNVGIGSATPGQKMDVQGTLRVFNGNLGIGTTPVNALLEINSANTQYQLENPASTGYVVNVFKTDLRTWEIGSANSGENVFNIPNKFVLYDAGAGAMRLTVDGSGNLGVGTVSPSALLEVGARRLDVLSSGNVGIGSVAPNGLFDVEGTISPVVFNAIANASAINVGIGSFTPGQKLDVQGTIRTLGEIVNGNVGIGTSSVNGPGEGALTIMNGNVGIGTWVPNDLLEVQGTLNSFYIQNSGNVGIGSNAPQGVIDYENGANAFIVSPEGLYQQSGTANWSFSAPANINLDDNFAGGVAMIVENDSSSASAYAQMTLSSDTGHLYMAVNSSTSAGSGGPDGVVIDNPNNAILAFQTQFIDRLSVAGNGNIGIGSDNPGQLLDVDGTARMTGFTLTGNGAAPGSIMTTNAVGVGTWMAINTISSAGGIVSETPNEIAYYSGVQTLAGSSNMVLNSNNVGLGTVTPLATLQVVGNIGIGTNKNGDKFITTSPPNGGMIVEGNVGIGTWVPTAFLEIAPGTVKSPPIQLNSGTLNTSVGAGSVEYDGTAFYVTAANSSRQVIRAEQFMDLSSPNTGLLNQAAAQAVFNSVTNNGALNVQANTMYFMEGQYLITVGTARNMEPAFGGNATLTSINYSVLAYNGPSGTETATTYDMWVSTRNQTDVVTTNEASAILTFQGTVRVSGAGTFIPEIGFNNTPTTITIGIDSYFRMWPVGSNTTTNQGDWT